MRPGRLGSNSSATLVRSTYSRTEVKVDLAERGLQVGNFRWSIFTLRRMSVGQYQHMLGLLSRIHAHIENDLRFTEPAFLILPWAGNLRGVKIERILESGTAMAQIFDRCVKVSNGITVDLTVLPWIYKTYATH